MAKTNISVLTQEKWLEKQLSHCIIQSNYEIGEYGNDEKKFLHFLSNNTMADHVLFIKPARHYNLALDETFLRKIAKIDLISIVGPIPEEHIPLIQKSNVRGYLSYPELSTQTITQLIPGLQKDGFYPKKKSK